MGIIADIKKSLIHLTPTGHESLNYLNSSPFSRYEREGRYSVPRDAAIVEYMEEEFGSSIADREDVQTLSKVQLKDAELDIGDEFGDVKLKGYQVVGSRFLLDTGRCILADDTGIGKSIQAVNASKHRRTLIISPLNKCEDWVHTAGEENCVRAFGKKKAKTWDIEAGYVVTNYESVNKKFSAIFDTEWEAIILEEAHYLQNRSSKRTKAIKELVTKNSKSMVWMLTATPVWNEPDTIWSLLNILDPTRFGSYWRFVETFCKIVETKFARTVSGAREDTLPVFRRIVAEFMLRREKGDVLNLPDRVEHHIWLPTTKEFRKEIRTMRREMREYEGHVNLATLRHHILANGDKKEALRKILETEKDKKILIFVKYRQSADLALSWVKEMTEGYCNDIPITGDIPVPQRQAIIQEFKDYTGGGVLLGTAKCMGTGLDLQYASVVVFLEHPFLYSELDQCCGRIERIGTTENPTYYHLVHEGTVDADVWKSCMSRSDTSSGIIG